MSFRQWYSIFFLAGVLIINGCKEKQNSEQNIKAANIELPSNVVDDSSSLILSKKFITGHFDPQRHPLFVKIDSSYTTKKNIYLHGEAYEAFKKMYAAAKKDKIHLIIRSAARNFDYQKSIWERKWTGQTKIENGKDASVTYRDPVQRAKAILRYSSMPGTSRHHWGTDIDLNQFENEWFEKGKGLQVYEWLIKNAGKFGFCQVYTAKSAARPSGYEEEKWHWSYVPIARELTRYASEELRDEDIGGFRGAETASTLNIVDNYILGIEPHCK